MILIMAWRNIWRNKARSIIILSSVAIGLLAGIFILGLYKGMIEGRVRIVIRDEVSHLQLHQPDFRKDYEAGFFIPDSGIAAAVSAIPQVKAVSPRDIAQGMLSTATGSNGVEIKGVLADSERMVSELDKKITAGHYFTPGKKNELLIGKRLFDKMKLKTGNKVVITFTDKDNDVVSAAFRIAGVFQSTNSGFEERVVYVGAGELAALLDVPGKIHELAVLLYGDEQLENVKRQLQIRYPNLLIETWKEISPETELSVSTTNQLSLIIIAIIMLALAFGIVNTMLMAVLERTRETGMMLALGMTRPRLFLLVVSETIFLTLAGTPAGLALSWGTIYFTSRHGIDTASFAKDLMSSFGYSSVIYPRFPIDQLFSVIGIVGVTAAISAILPAVKALRLRPVEALRR